MVGFFLRWVPGLSLDPFPFGLLGDALFSGTASVDSLLFTVSPLLSPPERGLAFAQTCLSDHHNLAASRDRCNHTVPRCRSGHIVFLAPSVDQPLLLIQTLLPPVDEDFPLIDVSVALVKCPFAPISVLVTFVGISFALVGDFLTVISSLFPLFKQLSPLLQQETALRVGELCRPISLQLITP
jgi:hypothetical protein